MSVSDGDGDGDATGNGEAGGSAIVAYEATRREKRMFLYSKCVLQDETMLKNENCIVFFFQKIFKQITSLDPPPQTNNNCLGEGHSTINLDDNKRFQQFNK